MTSGENFHANNTNESATTDWDVLIAPPQPEVEVDLESFSIDELNQDRHRLQAEFYQDLNDKEKLANFNQYVATVKELHAEDPEVILPRTDNYQEETILLYETLLTTNKKIADAKMRNMDPEERAAAEGPHDSNRHCLEVQSSRLYQKRIQALQVALDQAAVTNEEKLHDNAILDATRQLYEAHRDLTDWKKNPQPADMVAAHEYRRLRATAHNNLIQNLNAINDMCQKYHVTRLTYRNFMASDPDSMHKITSALNARQEEDRAIVEQYFSAAYGEYSLKKSVDQFARGGIISEKDGGVTNLLDDLHISPEEADDKAYVRMRQVIHLAEKLKSSS